MNFKRLKIVSNGVPLDFLFITNEEMQKRYQVIYRRMCEGVFDDCFHAGWLGWQADVFSRSISTIVQNRNNIFVWMKVGPRILTPSAQLKVSIKDRDNNTCQYCGKINPEYPEVEHVICCWYFGYTEPYNLVLSCKSCNLQKGKKVWVPRNIEELALINSEWALKINRMSVWYKHQNQFVTDYRKFKQL